MAPKNDMELAGGGADAPPVAPPPDKGEDKNTVVLSADHFPQGIKPKNGDKLTFCVTGEPDEEGNVSGYFEAGEGKEETWEDGFRKSMSPTAPAEEAA